MSVYSDRRTALTIAGGALLAAFAPSAKAAAATVQVAVAANFAAPMREIALAFERATGHKALLSWGSTGKFYAQITQGAPFDLLLAADAATPDRLVREGHAIPNSQRAYATGRLALFSLDKSLVDSQGEVLKTARFKRLSIANPKIAPYGIAAEQTLSALGLIDALKPKLVQAESVAQVMQQVQSGNAQLGFVALSQIQGDADTPKGSSWLVPERLHAPIQQRMVLIKRADANPATVSAAVALHGWMLSDAARLVMKRFGYR